MIKFKTTTIEETESVYSILREKYNNKQIEIEFNYNTKEYTLLVTNKEFKYDPEVPLDLNIEVVYGDSVTGDTPLLLKKDGLIYIETIENIFDENKKVEYPGFKMFDKSIRIEKEYAPTDYTVWTDAGWVNIKKVIRHKCNKKIYRVLTHTGCVDVTEDHSLITSNLENIKPNELKVGDSLLHSFPNEFVEMKETIVKMEKRIERLKVCKECHIEKDINDFYKQNSKKDGYNSKCKECKYYKNSSHSLRNTIKDFKFENYVLTEKEAEVWGFFMGDGSCGEYHCKSGIKNSWALNNNNMDRLNYFKDILEKIEPIKFVILDTLKSSGVYKLVPKGSIKYMVDKYRHLFYYQQDCNSDGDKYKIVPNCILNASKEIKLAYWKGYWEADGEKTRNYSIENPSFAIKGKIGAQCMYYLMRSIGFNIGLNITNHPKKQEIYFLSKTTFKLKNETVVKKIVDRGESKDYVYDLETDIGRFGCGVGQIQTINTDSVFLRFKYNRDDFERNRIDTFKMATLCGDNLTDIVFDRPPIVLEFEKVFNPFILLTKKRYIAKKYENMKDPFYLKGIDAKGIALTRRDYCLMVKKCYREIIDTIMDNSNKGVDVIERSLGVFRNYLERIDKYDIEMDDLIISAQIGKDYSCKHCKQKTSWILRCENKSGSKVCNTLNPQGLEVCKKCKAKIKCVHSFSLAHINLAQRMLNRNDEVTVGDRLAYIYVENSDPKAAKNEMAEDPKYAVKNGLKLNRLCYLEQVAKPILGLYRVCLQHRQEELDDIIEFVNSRMIKYGGKKLKPSDYKIEDE